MYPSTFDRNYIRDIFCKAEFREHLNIGFLQPHQELIKRYMSPFTPYDRLLLYHTMGTGKSFICIAIAEDHYNMLRRKCVVITKGSTSSDSFKNQISLWLKRNDPNVTQHDIKKYMYERYLFYHHASFCKGILAKNKVDESLTQDIILIVDEVHNIVTDTKSSNINSLLTLRNYIRNLKDSKVLLLSGTPMTNDLSRIPYILEMLLPDGYCVTDDMLVSRQDLFPLMRGRISYYDTARIDVHIRYIGERYKNFEMPICTTYMTDIQARTYIDIMHSDKSAPMYTDHVNASLFVFSDGTYGRFIGLTNKIICHKVKMQPYISAYNKELRRGHTCNTYTVAKEFLQDINYDNLSRFSCKYHRVITEILKRSNQKCFIFIKEIIGSGLILFSCILEQLGYEMYHGESLDTISKKLRYTMCVGNPSISPNNKDRVAGFNDMLNVNGEYIQIMLGSNVMSESISLLNVRHFHCLSPHWNLSNVNQALRRVIRKNSHKALDKADRTVDVFIHVAKLKNDIDTIDIRKLDITIYKELNIEPVRKNLKLSSLEHILYIHDSWNINNLDYTTYINYIYGALLDKYINDISNSIKDGIDVNTLSLTSNIPLYILKYILRYMITYNIPVRDYYGRSCYIRESRNILTLTHNILLQYSDIDTSSSLLTYKITYIVNDTYDVDSFIDYNKDMHPIQVINNFNNVKWKYRIKILERIIETNNNMRNNVFSNSIIDFSSKIYHIYNYRKPLRGKYKSSARGVKPQGLTRCFNPSNNTWCNASYMEEERVLLIYRNYFSDIELNKSIHNITYIYSTVDMILRVSFVDEAVTMDMRIFRRGRNIDTLQRCKLVRCANTLGIDIDSNNDTTSRYIITLQILNKLIDNDLIVYA